MSQTVKAFFDGEVFGPEEKVDLEPNTSVRLTILRKSQSGSETVSFLDTAASLKLDGPPDGSSRIDEYLYGDLTETEE